MSKEGLKDFLEITKVVGIIKKGGVSISKYIQKIINTARINYISENIVKNIPIS